MSTGIKDYVPTYTDEAEPGDPLRWMATITFLADKGTICDIQTFEEIEDLHRIIEDGPNFYAIESIIVVINPEYFKAFPLLKQTIEESARS